MTIVVPSHIWEYIVATTLIILVPGPSVLFTIARAISFGRLIAIATVFGNGLGVYLISIAVALGLGPLLSHSTCLSRCAVARRRLPHLPRLPGDTR
jgi:threonine/homoserine/homoserine lactone efflux protein